MIKKLFIVGALLSVASTIHPVMTTASALSSNSPAIWDYVDELEDGAVYFIRSCANTNQVLDIPAANYSNGQDLILYSSNGAGNQRFILNKEERIEGVETYSFTPVQSLEKRLVIDSDNKMKVGEVNYWEQDLKTEKFYFTPGITPHSFRISSVNNDKVITTQNYNTSNNSKICSLNYNSNYSQYYDWYLQKTDSIGINVANKVTLNGTNAIWFNLEVPSSGVYVLETKKINYYKDTLLYLYNQNESSLLDSDDDGGENNFSKIEYNFTEKTTYRVKLTGYNSSDVGDISLSICPKKTFTVLTYVGKGQDTLDTRIDSIVPKQVFKNKGYYVDHRVNISSNDLFRIKPDGQTFLNTDYVMFSGHGYMDWVQLNPNDNTDDWYLRTISLNKTNHKMTNCKLAFWNACNAGTPGGLAQKAAEVGAEYSIGFDKSISSDIAKDFGDYLWTNVMDNQNVPTAVTNTIDSLVIKYWGDDFKGKIDEPAFTPCVYQCPSANTLSLVKPKQQKSPFIDILFSPEEFTFNIFVSSLGNNCELMERGNFKIAFSLVNDNGVLKRGDRFMGYNKKIKLLLIH